MENQETKLDEKYDDQGNHKQNQGENLDGGKNRIMMINKKKMMMIIMMEKTMIENKQKLKLSLTELAMENYLSIPIYC
jgi:hypothetical protein